MATPKNIVPTKEDPATLIRTWLAETLRGASPGWTFSEDFDSEQILASAQREGIITLLHQRLLESPHAQALPPTFRDKLAAAAKTKVAQALIREHHCRVILARLDKAGVPALLLKGSALAYWAYTSPYLRECSDIDLLLRSRTDADRVVAILDELKFDLREKALPGDLVCFEMTCVGTEPANSGLEVDLHWRLSSAPLFAFRFDWDELVASAISLHALGECALGIAATPAFMHACMHRVQNMAIGHADTLKWLYDLRVLGERFSSDDWDDLTRMAIERGLAGTCLQGIQAAESCFGEIAPAEVRLALAAAVRSEVMVVGRMDGWWYIQRMNLLAIPGIYQRLRWIRQRLIPARAYRQTRYGSDKGFWRSMAQRVRSAAMRLRN